MKVKIMYDLKKLSLQDVSFLDYKINEIKIWFGADGVEIEEVSNGNK